MWQERERERERTQKIKDEGQYRVYVKNKKIKGLKDKLSTRRSSRISPSESTASRVPVHSEASSENDHDQTESSVVSTLWNAMSSKFRHNIHIKRKMAEDSENTRIQHEKHETWKNTSNSKLRSFGINLPNFSPTACRTPASTVVRRKKIADFFRTVRRESDTSRQKN